MSMTSSIPSPTGLSAIMWRSLTDRDIQSRNRRPWWVLGGAVFIGCCLPGTAAGQCRLGDIVPSAVQEGSAFGWSLDGDADRLVVGAYYGQGSNAGTGAVHVFRRCGIKWVIEAEISAPDGLFGDYFGSAVALHGDVLLVGAFGVKRGGSTGAAYLYRRLLGVWQFQTRVDPPPGRQSRQFGYALDLQHDLAIVSAFADDHGEFTGRAFAYRLEGPSLVLEDELVPLLDPDAVMGWSVSLDQSRALIGAASASSESGIGAAYIFQRDPVVGWRQTAKLESPTPSPTAGFGKSVSIQNQWAVVGAYHESAAGHQSGAVHVYRFTNSAWVHESALTGATTASHDYFGQSVDLGDDSLVVGAAGKDLDGTVDHGQGHFFRWEQGAWMERQELQGIGMGERAGLGFAVAAIGDMAVISAASADAPMVDAGRVLAFVVGGPDCNDNAVMDGCDIVSRSSADADVNGVPDECQPHVCPWDCAAPPNGAVDVDDLLAVIDSWGAQGGWTAADQFPPGGDGVINIDDLLALLEAWGPCGPSSKSPAIWPRHTSQR